MRSVSLLPALLCFILVVVIIVGAVVAVAMAVRAKKRREREAAARNMPRDPFADVDADVLRGDPRRLKAGDIFDTHGETLTVRGSLRLREGGYQWSEHLIDTGSGVKRWLSVEEDPDLELVLWTAVSGRHAPAPGPEYIEYDGKRFRSQESGSAQYISEATTGLAGNGRMTYHDYVADDGTRLSYEDFDQTGHSEVALGLRIERNEITIYPQQP